MTALLRRCILLIAVLVGAVSIPATPVGASNGGVWTGTCPVMSFSISQPGRLLPTSGAVGMSASGSCTGTTPEQLVLTATGSFGMSPVPSASFGCLSGVAVGQGTVSAPGLPLINVSITVVNHGGTITVTLLAPVRFEAVATFAATSVLSCGSNGVLSGLGSMTYFDPTLPPPLS